jgi:cysteinyl-tRNA synthetase
VDIYLTNTLSRKKEKFEPITDSKVNLFVCGPTVYDYSHIGHGKTYTQFDVLVRYLKYVGYEVFYLQNITNIDDKILNRAKEKNVSWKELSEKFEKLYMDDMGKLNNTSVTKYARATDYIDQIIKQVKTLMEKGYAYKIDDGIYFEISKFPDYGKLSGRIEIKEGDSQSRIDENPQKHGWNDFCLWKFSKPGESFWETGLGNGRPGWHIEDTAITETFFGPQYDVHGGAVDLIIPHHEAEIAQMESASGKKPLVKYWLHTGFLMVDGKKMSKSLGNFYTIDDVVRKGFDPMALRYLFLGSQYRETMNFTWDSLTAAQNALTKLRAQIAGLKSQDDRTVLSDEKLQKVDEYKNNFISSLADDLNVPQALAVLWGMLKSNIPSGDKYELSMSFDEVLGLNLSKTPKLQESKIPSNIKILILKREELRKEKKFGEADEIRKQIEEAGFKVNDTSI